jgi:antitoxin ParD1/3/4
MAKNTSVTLGKHFEEFIGRQIERGRYGSASEVVRAGLRLLEEHENRVEALKFALEGGEQSGDAGEMNADTIKKKARASANQSS